MKKIFSIIIAIVLLASVLVGCSNKGNGGIYEIDFYYPINAAQTPQDQNKVEDAMNEILVEKLECKVKLHPIPVGNYEAKMSTLIGAADKFDLCWTSSWMNNYYQNVELRAFESIEDLLKEHAPTVWSQIPEKVWSAARVDGEIYAAIGLQILPRTPGLSADKEMMEAYMASKSITQEQLKEEFPDIPSMAKFMEFVKQQKPNAEPQMTGQISMTAFQTVYGFDDIAGNTMPGVVSVYDDPNEINPDGNYVTVFNQFETEEYKECLLAAAEWKAKGYTRPNPLESNYDATKSYVNLLSTWKPGCYIDEKELVSSAQNPDKDVMVFATGDPVMYNSYLVGNMIGVSSTSENKVKSVQFLEELAVNKELYNILAFGIEGTHYKKVEGQENRIEPLEGSVRYDLGKDSWQFVNQFNAYLRPGQEDDIWEQTKELNNDPDILYSPIIGFSFDISKVRVQVSTCKTEYVNFDSPLMTGYYGNDSESKWREFVSRLKQAGADQIIAEKQRQLNEWLAAQK